jgi:Mg2+/Co2+ transporter CorB
VNYVFGRIPATNDIKKIDGYEVVIMKRNRQSVESIKLKVLEAA